MNDTSQSPDPVLVENTKRVLAARVAVLSGLHDFMFNKNSFCRILEMRPWIMERSYDPDVIEAVARSIFMAGYRKSIFTLVSFSGAFKVAEIGLETYQWTLDMEKETVEVIGKTRPTALEARDLLPASLKSCNITIYENEVLTKSFEMALKMDASLLKGYEEAVLSYALDPKYAFVEDRLKDEVVAGTRRFRTVAGPMCLIVTDNINKIITTDLDVRQGDVIEVHPRTTPAMKHLSDVTIMGRNATPSLFRTATAIRRF